MSGQERKQTSHIKVATASLIGTGNRMAQSNGMISFCMERLQDEEASAAMGGTDV